MDNQAVAQPGAVAIEPPSTVLNPETVSTVSGGGVPNLTEPDDSNDSIESVLDAELKSLREADAKAAKDKPDDGDKADEKKVEAKDDKDAKADDKAKEAKTERQRNEQGKFAKVEAEKPEADGDKGEPEKAATGQDGSERGRPSEGRQHIDPPARFLPKEREGWANVPNVVKSAIDRISKEHETEVSQYRASHEEWSKLAKFDAMAKQHNVNIADALERYTTFDGLLQSNPIEAIRQIMATRGITPEQYANHVLNNPEAHRAPPPSPAPDPMVQQMGSKVQQLEATIEEMRAAQAASSIIEPFRAQPEHSRYDELQDDIAFFLQSGKIPASLTPQERLEAAYDMAVRINPTSAVEASQVPEAPAAKPASPAKPAAGTKSIRGAPDSGSDTEPEEPDDDLQTMLRKQLRRMSA